MTNVAVVMVVSGVSIVCIVGTWLIVSRQFNQKVENYKSIREAIDSAGGALEALRKTYNETSRQLKKRNHELGIVEGRTRELVELESRANEIRDLLKNGREKLENLKALIREQKVDRDTLEIEIHRLKSELDLYTQVMDFVDYGLYEEPEYLHETSERYKVEIKRVREKQKELIKDKCAIELPDDIQIEGSSRNGKAILSGQAKMMFRTFNIECDLLFEKLNLSNFARTLERIEKISDGLEKTAVSLMCGFSIEYVKLKYRECELQYEFKLKKTAEQEEQRLIREQMREEEKANREFQRAIDAAEKEERMYEKLLEKAKAELLLSKGAETADLEAKIALLQTQLDEAFEKESRAKSLAEQTKRGHIYIISNIGSFGDDVYKIGLTRRLDPLDRVKELGDASVPFRFDVHAIVYSDDAPAMEAELHRKFNALRVNAVNRRKEFFRVSLGDIKLAVENITGDDVDFRMTALAEEYHESQRLLGAAIGAADLTVPV